MIMRVHEAKENRDHCFMQSDDQSPYNAFFNSLIVIHQQR